jgi:hypothetical protein
MRRRYGAAEIQVVSAGCAERAAQARKVGDGY